MKIPELPRLRGPHAEKAVDTGLYRLQAPPYLQLQGTYPQGPCTSIETTWAQKGLLYHDFGAYVCTPMILLYHDSGAYVCTIMILGHFRLSPGSSSP